MKNIQHMKNIQRIKNNQPTFNLRKSFKVFQSSVLAIFYLKIFTLLIQKNSYTFTMPHERSCSPDYFWTKKTVLGESFFHVI